MARVVHRRSAPPYLAIVFVGLFVIAAALAVMFYVQREGEIEKQAAKNRDISKYRSRVEELENTTIPELLRKITGRQGPEITSDYALKEIDKVFTDLANSQQAYKLPISVNPSDGLVKALESLGDHVPKDQEEKIGALRKDKARLEEELKTSGKTIADMQAAQKGQLDDLQAKLAAATARTGKDVAAKQKELDDAVAAKVKIIGEKDARIAALGQEVETKVADLRLANARNEQYLKIIEELKGTAGDPSKPLIRKPDGKVAKVLNEQSICYIDLGADDQATPGLPFSVYSHRTGVTEDKDAKAQIVVLNVGRTTSECRIVKVMKDDPIVENDVIANVVFNTSRTYNFVVGGEFDLLGTGRIDPLDAGRVRRLIEEFGGRVTDTINVNTDFLVLGEEPPLPSKPDPAAGPIVLQDYKTRKAKYDEYLTFKDTALKLRVPILNTTRFLALTGFVPKKRLAE